ncbi:MAG TPA: MazG nucleotide pyrophosphohydrolase domain-containing protein [Candidatus Saccharimonadia bacterium]|jgi:NTP pyrophosphatase (non-canonical NTP hydrolase)
MNIAEIDNLKDIQTYIWDKNKERGFSEEAPERKLLMLMEESGELAKAVRKSIGMGFSDSTKTTDVKEELADVQIILLGLASTLNIDMLEAVREKEQKNSKRSWS